MAQMNSVAFWFPVLENSTEIKSCFKLFPVLRQRTLRLGFGHFSCALLSCAVHRSQPIRALDEILTHRQAFLIQIPFLGVINTCSANWMVNYLLSWGEKPTSVRASNHFLCGRPVKFCHPLDSFPMYEPNGSPQIRMVRWENGFCNCCDCSFMPKNKPELQSTCSVAP